MVSASHVALAYRPLFKRSRSASRREEKRAMPPAGGYAIAHQKQSAFKRCLRRAIRCRPIRERLE
ncbi:hypothetical protein [Nostoc sp.]|uniref:hypothetical protein n=1 Tax=Nostoc sp. TaxID=1180 RepID=UPI002FFCE568